MGWIEWIAVAVAIQVGASLVAIGLLSINRRDDADERNREPKDAVRPPVTDRPGRQEVAGPHPPDARPAGARGPRARRGGRHGRFA